MRIPFLFKSFLVYCLLMMIGRQNVNAQQYVQRYLEQHRQLAIVLMKKTGIPASIILGVSMIESAMGQSRNCKLLHNYFGIKGKNNLSKNKGGPRSAYKQYKNATESFKDFVRIVQRKAYYAKLKNNTDYMLWLKAMNKHGYAEAQGKWIKDISLVIRKYKLEDLDKDLLIYDDDSFPIWGVDSISLELMD